WGECTSHGSFQFCGARELPKDFWSFAVALETRNMKLETASSVAECRWLNAECSLLKFPVNSLFLCIGITKTRNPCGFSRRQKKIPCYWEFGGEDFAHFVNRTTMPPPAASSRLSVSLRRCVPLETATVVLSALSRTKVALYAPSPRN